MQIHNFHELFVRKLQAIYDAENQITEAMPTMIDLCSSPELKESFQKHMAETEAQKTKLEDLCNDMNIELEGPSNIAMEGMIDEAMEMLQDNQKSPVLDAALIAAAQSVEHYEISCYGTAAEWAEQMGHTDAQKVLAEIMNEEKKTDELLSEMAIKINKQAAAMQQPISMSEQAS